MLLAIVKNLISWGSANSLSYDNVKGIECFMSPTPCCLLVSAQTPQMTGRGGNPGFPGSIFSGAASCCLCSLVIGWPHWAWHSQPWKSYLVVFSEPSSGIFSSEQLLPESLSRWSNSLKRSATHCAVSRASGSWSQHSVRVSHTIWIPWWLSQELGISGRPRSLNTLSFMLSTQGCSRTLEPNGGS